MMADWFLMFLAAHPSCKTEKKVIDRAADKETDHGFWRNRSYALNSQNSTEFMLFMPVNQKTTIGIRVSTTAVLDRS